MPSRRPPPDRRPELPPSGLLTSREVARLLRVHPKHVYRLLRAGMPAMKVGGDWRFEPARVLEWAAGRGQGHGDSAEGPASADAASLAANDAEAVAILLAWTCDAKGPVFGRVAADSRQAIDLLANGRATVAAYHREDVPSRAGGRPLARVRFVTREVGIVARPGRRVPSLAACADRRLASRPETSGARWRLDRVLASQGLSSARVHRRATCWPSHRDVVFAVVRGDADWGVTSRDWAERAGLPFRALDEERYDLLVPTDRLGHEPVLRLLDALATPALRRALGALPGHSADEAGLVHAISAQDPART